MTAASLMVTAKARHEYVGLNVSVHQDYNVK